MTRHAARSRRSNGATRRSLSESGPRRRDWRWARRLVGGLVFSVLVGALGWVGHMAWLEVEAKRVEVVRVEGQLVNVREADIQGAMAAYMNESLISLDLERLQQGLERLDWVKQVRIRREWPDTLHVSVSEHRAIARWQGEQVLNQDGQVFRARGADNLLHLPFLDGPHGSEEQVMTRYQQFSQVLYPYGLKLRAVQMNSRGAWQLTLDNGVQVNVGNKEVMTRMRRLAAFLEVLAPGRLHDIATLDLRYANGIAVAQRPNVLEKMVSR